MRKAFDIRRGPDTILPITTGDPRSKHLMETFCKHPKVRVVAREEDAEYVECQECGEVFDSNEFRDMAIEGENLEDSEA
jgi:hypothetical protein